MAQLLDVIIGSFLGSSVVTALLGVLFLRRNKTIETQIEAQFSQGLKVFESTRSWKEQALAELFGPLQMQLERTKRAFERWDNKNLHLEAEVIQKGNIAIRDLLLAKGHLIPAQLMAHAIALIEHYDAWIEAYNHIRSDTTLTANTDFVFVGPAGYPFPAEAEQAFKAQFKQLQQELYGV
ncbi:hypothetical protein [Rheinheimera aquimaris]|jgi:hypothetical protein|uniref:hypothetical protein n=1 Tax=Rheinheimera aquimaris TaxID=412437 RepID=UPI001E4CD3B9|nr:hypothetical protein [Rheinheimera aquimaris]MCD1598436.1 hypothetical protein [Rheinheimera aquimaris]